MAIERVRVALYATYNCAPADDTAQQAIQLSVNGRSLPDTLMAPNSMCFCGNCPRVLEFVLSKDQVGVYRAGQNNTFVVRVVSPASPAAGYQICLSRLQVDVLAHVDDPTVFAVAPLASPVEGRTRVVFEGSGFGHGNATAQMCYFGDDAEPVNATNVEGTTKFECVSPPHAAGTVALRASVLMPSGKYFNMTAVDFCYFAPPTVVSYEPKRAVTEGGTRVTLRGSFAATNSSACIFESASGHAVVMEATYEGGGGGGGGGGSGSGADVALQCFSPQWQAAEKATLSVSLDGQQHNTSVGPFEFVADSAPVLVYVLACLGVVVGAAAVVVAAVWLKHRHTLDGYERIREGTVAVTMKEVTLGERIGRGTFGEVYRGTWRGAVVAVKKLTAQTISEEFVREFEKEVSLMRSLRSPNVLQFLGSAFQPPNNICIVMEYMSRGSLYHILHEHNNVLEWRLLLHMIADTARGMTYLHTCTPPVIHRDLKSHNLLVDEFWRVKVCDFGLSTVLEQQSQTLTACGTPCWTAPEVLKHLHYTVKADVYSFGIVLWECMTRTDPYQGMAPFKVIFAVGREKLRPRVPPGVPPEYVALMTNCWDDDPDARPDFATILDRVEAMEQLNWSGQPAPHVPLTAASAQKAKAAASPSPSTTPSPQPPATTTTTTTVSAGGSGISDDDDDDDDDDVRTATTRATTATARTMSINADMPDAQTPPPSK